MLPIRFASPRVTSRLAGFALVVWLAGTLAERGIAGPLPAGGVDYFRRVLVRDRGLSADEDTAARDLTERRKELRDAASLAHLPSLGDVTGALLLADWRSTEVGDFETPKVPTKQAEAAVRLPSDAAFERQVRNLLKMAGDDFSVAVQLIAAEIRRDVRLSLLDRLETRLHFYLREGRVVDRIAAANLITDTMSAARRLDNPEQLAIITDERKSGMSSQKLRERLQKLAGDLEQATRDPEPQVQVAAVRALSDLEVDTALGVATLRPLLNAGTNVAVRRTAAQGLGHMVELIVLQDIKNRPQPALRMLAQLFPAAAAGLSDEDVAVRRASLAACQRVATALDDLVTPNPYGREPSRETPREQQPIVVKRMMAVVQKALPNLNRGLRDPVPELRISACHLLETMALLTQKAQRLDEEGPLPPPSPEPSPKPPVKERGKEPRKVGMNAGRSPSSRHHGDNRPSQWAVSRSEAAPRPALRDNPLSPVATLGRPMKLMEAPPERPTGASIQPAAFVARQIDELPVPRQLEIDLQSTVEAMIEGLSDRNYRVRLASVDVLETFGDRAAPAIPALVKTLGDPNKFIRWSAARTLGRLAPRAIARKEAPDVVRGLVTLLNDREDLSVRITAAYALEQYGPSAKAAVTHLARVINRGDKEYIIAILHTLQGIGTDATPALPNVAWVLNSRELPSSVRVEAARTLGRFGSLAKDQLPILREIMVSDSAADVRNAASTAVLAVDRPK